MQNMGRRRVRARKKMICLFNFVCVSLEAFIAAITRKLITLEWFVRRNERTKNQNTQKPKRERARRKKRKQNKKTRPDSFFMSGYFRWHFQFKHFVLRVYSFGFFVTKFSVSVFHSLKMVIGFWLKHI